MNANAIFQYLIHDLQSMGNEAEILPAQDTIKRPSIVFANPKAPLDSLTSVAQCIEAGELLEGVHILRFITNLEAVATSDTQALALSLDHIYPMFRFIASEDHIFARMDIPISENALWESAYMLYLISFYQATLAYNAPIFQDLGAGKLSLEEATNRTRTDN
jgi:hypothetical protein